MGGKCDIMTQEEMFWNRWNSVVTHWTLRLAVAVLDLGQALTHSFIHSFIQLSLKLLEDSLSLVSVVGLLHKHVMHVYKHSEPSVNYLLFKGLFIFYVYKL